MHVGFQYPHIHILGLDRDPTLLRYAQTHAQVQGLENVSFELLESIPALYDCPTFDVIQTCFLSGFPRFRADFLASDDWASLLATSLHLLRPRGTLHLMETAFLETSSTALELTYNLFLQAIAKREETESVRTIPFLKRWAQAAGYEQIIECIHLLNCSAGERAFIGFFEQIRVAFKLLQPFLVQMGVITQQQIDRLYEHMLIEMMSEDFCAIWFIVDMTAQKPR
jgi:hypothetical protein